MPVTGGRLAPQVSDSSHWRANILQELAPRVIRGVAPEPLPRVFSGATGQGVAACFAYFRNFAEEPPTSYGVGRCAALGTVDRREKHFHFRIFRHIGGGP